MVRRSRLSKRRALVLVAAASVLAAGCANTEEPLEIGFRRVALDLAFKDAEKAIPVEASQVVTRYIDTDYRVEDVETQTDEGPRIVRRVKVIPARPQRDCPVAPAGATPEFPAFAVVKDPPKVGSYPRHNTGQLRVQLATQTFDIPVPELSTWEIPEVRTVRGHRLVADSELETAAPPDAVRSNDSVLQNMNEFDLTRRILPGYSTTDTYRYTNNTATGGDFLYLVKRVTVARGEETVFVPSPPIRVVRLNVSEGTLADSGVVHAGVDRSTNVALAIQSQIVGRETVDVCGDIVDTYRVQVKELFTNLAKTPPEVSGNEGDTTNYWNVAFDNGILIVREEVHSTLRTTTNVLGQRVPITVTYDYTSTLDKTTPDPIAAKPTTATTSPSPSNNDEEEG